MLFGIFLFVAAFAFALALTALARERGTPGHLSFVIGLALLALETGLSGCIIRSETARDAAFWRGWAYLPQAVIPSVWVFFSLNYSRGNHERFLRKWLLPLGLSAAVPVGAVFLLQDTLVAGAERGDNAWLFHFGFGGFVTSFALLACSAVILINLERTFRASVGTYRWRIKFIILGVGIIFTARLYTSSQALLFQQADSSLDVVKTAALLIACAFFARALFRPGTFRVEVYPSERVLHYSVVGFCIGAYLIVVGALSKRLSLLGGSEAFALKAFLLVISLAALAVVLLSERARDKFRRYISRQFHRPIYNYRTTWLSFTSKTATVLDAASLCRVSAEWLSENLHALSVSFWLVDEESRDIQLAASTGITEKAEAAPSPSHAAIPPIIEGLKSEAAPFDIDRHKLPWVDQLKTCYPDILREGGSRVCVPLSSNGLFVGFISLSDRVNFIPFGLEEFDLLKCVGDQIASSLLNLQLSQKLMRAKEMEAFQTIAAFFVHDLKNTASGLNLTVQNLPKYWDNAEFRKDAVKTIGKSVHHIQELITRLSLFRQNLQVQRQETDLNELVTASAECLNGHAVVSRDMGSLPKVKLDPDQMQKVFTNLLLNAREALREDGRIKISTSERDGWAVAEVADNGCGMPPEFIARSLFRPFQTTKKGGIGIGMFQTKTIVEAHGGKIEVESDPARGTTFRVFLPLSAPSAPPRDPLRQGMT